MKTALSRYGGMGLAVLLATSFLPVMAASAQQTFVVGMARVNINPGHPQHAPGDPTRALYPIRLGYSSDHRPQTDQIGQNLWAKALCIGNGTDLLLLLSVDNDGLRREVTDAVANRLREKHNLAREQIAFCFSHSHTAPRSNVPATADPFHKITPAERANLQRYHEELIGKLVDLAGEALDSRTPGHTLHWAVGTVKFGTNRRSKEFPRPVDHDLPVLIVKDSSGAISAIATSYAAHAATITPAPPDRYNKIHGDWVGVAQEKIESQFPGAQAMVLVGAAGDQVPNQRGGDFTKSTQYMDAQGAEIANEIARLTHTDQLRAISSSRMLARIGEVKLELANTNGYAAPVSYPVQTWTFGNDLAMVFLGGEVVVEYGLRLKKELRKQIGASRLWVNAYSNDMSPGYIPSERVLAEGGYEAIAAKQVYMHPDVYAPGLEERIVDAVMRQLKGFAPSAGDNELD